MGWQVLSGDFLRNHRPLVANFVVELDEHQLLFDRPLHLYRLGADMVLISDCFAAYLSLHCLALLRGRP